MELILIKKEEQIIKNSETCRKGRRCFKCGNRGKDIVAVYYRSMRGKSRRHFLCADCRKIAKDYNKERKI
jgi:hypothetical protein